MSAEKIIAALDNLRIQQRQLDQDGVEVGVSREALNDAIRDHGRLTHVNEALVKALEEGLQLFDLVTALDDHGSDALGQAEITFRNALSLAKGEG